MRKTRLELSEVDPRRCDLVLTVATKQIAFFPIRRKKTDEVMILFNEIGLPFGLELLPSPVLHDLTSSVLRHRMLVIPKQESLNFRPDHSGLTDDVIDQNVGEQGLAVTIPVVVGYTRGAYAKNLNAFPSGRLQGHIPMF